MLPVSIPTFSRPKSFVSGTLPVAYITSSELTSFPLLNLVSNPDEVLETEIISVSVSSFIFKLFNSSVINLEISLSKPLNIFFPRYTNVTFAPKEANIPANSNAIYPPPFITILVGNLFRSRAASEFIQSSFP